MIKQKGQEGQSAVEFVLIAPLLFFIFFSIIQLSYFAYVSLATQRAALSIAQEAALTSERSSEMARTKLFFSLMPLARLNRTTLACSMASRFEITNRGKKVHVQLHYPMPIWVPLVGKILGEPIIPSADYNHTRSGEIIHDIFKILGKNPPDLSFTGLNFPYARWISFEAETFNEGFDQP